MALWRSTWPSTLSGLRLWQRLAIVLLPLLVLVTALELWMTRHDALEAANAAYDRSLVGALKAIDAGISTASGGLTAELPYSMLEFFELTASGSVYFRVATSDALVELGNADLPLPPRPLEPGVPRFYDAQYFGESLRLVAYQRPISADASLNGTSPGQSNTSVIVQVGESTQSRRDFTLRFVRRAALRDGLILVLMVLGAAGTLALALRPLARLAHGVKDRSPEDMTPIPPQDLPADIRPLVSAVNQHMARNQALITQQREFLDDASHQLRTHLTTLQMQVDYARREPNGDLVQQTLQALGTEIARATRSTQQLLALGRSDTAALDFAPLDLSSLLRTVALELLPQARAKQIDFGIQPPAPSHAMAVADAHLMHEALTNLAANAIAYTPRGGKVSVSVHVNGSQVIVRILDNGPGIAPQDRARAFKRFQRLQNSTDADSAVPGSGLGLAIAQACQLYGLIEAIGPGTA